MTSTVRRGSVIAGRYELVDFLGRGGMGTVFRARDQALGDDVALKVLRPEIATPEYERRFRGEVKIARRVRHRNVCAIHDYGQEAGLHYIVMELVEGVDLKHLVKERGALPLPEAIHLVGQLAAGLQAIHDAGIVHRDLKTPNVMVDRRGVVRLMDFGIAKSMDSQTLATAVGMILGTPEYMSPEQVRAATLDPRSDLYALGVVAFELLTGRVPFKGDTPLATLMMHLQDEPPLELPLAAGLPAGIRAALKRVLAKDPQERFATAAEFAQALAADGADAPRASARLAPRLAAADERAPIDSDEIPTALTPAPTPGRPPVAPAAPPPAPDWEEDFARASVAAVSADWEVDLAPAPEEWEEDLTPTPAPPPTPPPADWEEDFGESRPTRFRNS
ncbi:MAG: serine/threonine protein kinase [Vicinamibacteria bacterium]|nr:serine/threonine protein kinase [Vicinamibacteria bacterium]